MDWNEKLVQLWTKHPDLDINATNPHGKGHVLYWSTADIPSSVLKHPKININALNEQGKFGWTRITKLGNFTNLFFIKQARILLRTLSSRKCRLRYVAILYLQQILY